MTTLAGFPVEPDANGRGWCQLTRDRAHNYALYYFSPSITTDGRYLIHHSERSGWVQLYRLDLQTGASVPLTDGRTPDSGWGVWCEWRLRGIYVHLSALNPVRREVWYFQDEELRSTHVDTLANRLVLALPGRAPVGQSCFSPDGRTFGFIHADRSTLRRELADYEVRRNLDQFDWAHEHHAWRNCIPCTIATLDTVTGECRVVRELDHYVHHLLFINNDRLLINHTKNRNGMWTIQRDGSDYQELRPGDEHGNIVHQLVTANGIYYETARPAGNGRRNRIGRYDLRSQTFQETPLPDAFDGYVHTGFDPAGRFHFIEHAGRTHELLAVHDAFGRMQLQNLRTLAPYPKFGQRFHAHPFLSPDRRWIIHTEAIDGYAQICALDVTDLTQRAD